MHLHHYYRTSPSRLCRRTSCVRVSGPRGSYPRITCPPMPRLGCRPALALLPPSFPAYICRLDNLCSHAGCCCCEYCQIGAACSTVQEILYTGCAAMAGQVAVRCRQQQYLHPRPRARLMSVAHGDHMGPIWPSARRAGLLCCFEGTGGCRPLRRDVMDGQAEHLVCNVPGDGDGRRVSSGAWGERLQAITRDCSKAATCVHGHDGVWEEGSARTRSRRVSGG